MSSEKKPKKESSKELKSQVSQLEAKLAELTEALQRERADATNLRRQHDEQVVNLKTLVKAHVVRELLPVIDNFERALKHNPADSRPLTADSKGTKVDEWLKGVLSIKAQFDRVLESMGVERIKTVGEVFDPTYHEAISMEDDGGDVEVVSEELQAGYKLGDHVIRHAIVKVKMEHKS